MPENQRPAGDITLNFNSQHRTNRRAPALRGRISTPEAPKTFFPFVLFRQVGPKGTYFIGPVNMNRSLRQELTATSSTVLDNTNFVVARFNGFKLLPELDNGQPNPEYLKLSPEDRIINDAKPAYWGSWTRGPNDPVLRHSAWDRGMGQYGATWASGNVEHPLTAEELEALRQGDDEPMHALLNSPEAGNAPPDFNDEIPFMDERREPAHAR